MILNILPRPLANGAVARDHLTDPSDPRDRTVIARPSLARSSMRLSPSDVAMSVSAVTQSKNAADFPNSSENRKTASWCIFASGLIGFGSNPRSAYSGARDAMKSRYSAKLTFSSLSSPLEKRAAAWEDKAFRSANLAALDHLRRFCSWGNS